MSLNLFRTIWGKRAQAAAGETHSGARDSICNGDEVANLSSDVYHACLERYLCSALRNSPPASPGPVGVARDLRAHEVRRTHVVVELAAALIAPRTADLPGKQRI